MPDLGIIAYDVHLDDDEGEKGVPVEKPCISWRGLSNLLSLIALIGGIIALFVIYPVFEFYRYSDRNSEIISNPNINATGQAEVAAIGSRDQLPLMSVYHSPFP